MQVKTHNLFRFGKIDLEKSEKILKKRYKKPKIELFPKPYWPFYTEKLKTICAGMIFTYNSFSLNCRFFEKGEKVSVTVKIGRNSFFKTITSFYKKR